MESRSIDDVVYREGTICDYDEVINIVKDVHGGKDYLPWFYRVAAQTKGHHLFVAVANGKAVSFTGCVIDRDGDAISSFGSRTSPEWEGKAIMNNVKTYMYDYIKHVYPSIKLEISDAWLGNQLRPILPKMFAKGYREETRHILTVLHDTDKTKLEELIGNVHHKPNNFLVEAPGMNELNQKNEQVVFFLQGFGTYFVPARLWAPVAVTSGNVKRACTLDNVLLSYKDHTFREITGVSFQNIHPIPGGLRVNTCIYAHTEDEAMLFVYARIKHLLEIIPVHRFIWSPFLVFPGPFNYMEIADKLVDALGERAPGRQDDPLDAIILSKHI